ncbi:MAG TPA: lipase maturation factor family protein [Polyangiales bacterium]
MFDQLIDRLAAGLDPALVWGLVPRFVGALYAVAFASLAGQVLGLVGRRGISPAHAQLAAMREHFPGPLRFVRLPTLLWLSSSDRMLWALPRLGMVAGAYAVYGGPGSWFALLLCWAIYLSLDVCALMFPWDCFLIEAGFLTLFLPTVPALPVIESAQLPLPIAAFAFRFLLIRLMWGFAKLKFIGTKKGDSLYLRGFLAWMPMCTPLGYRMQHAPAWFLRFAYGFMWFVEVICPGLAFFRGAPRTIAALGLSALMAGIWATGNWGFFNVGYGALCVALLDTQGSLFDTTWAMIEAAPLTHATLFVQLFGSLLYFPVNSWATQTFIHWPFEDITWKRPWLRALIGFYRALAPFRFVHAYGVFPPNSSPPIKVLPVFEGSDDGVAYRPYGYRYMPTEPDSRRPIVAPHHPRIDHLCVYAGSGMSESDYLASLVGAGKSFGFSPFSHYGWLDRLAQRLLEGEPSVLALMGHNPFPERPPRYVRVSLRALTPQALGAQHAWRSRHLGVAFPARTLDPLSFEHWLPPPELFHPDFVHWRKKSPALRAMVRRSAALEHDAVLTQSDLTADEVERFWNHVVPAIAEGRADPGRIDAIAATLLAEHGKAQLLRYERLAERYVFMLRLRVEPHFYGDLEPKLDKRSNFRFHLLLHELILDGREAFEAALREPGKVAERAQHVTDRSLLTFSLVMRNQVLRYHGRALRIARCMTNVVEPHIPGILEFKDLLTEWVPPDEAWLPVCTREDDGVWRCPDFVEAE